MLAYFDLTFFSIMKIIESNNSTPMRKVATFFSYAFFVISVVIPVFFLAVLLRKFPLMKEKAGKAKFNTLVLKIDKGSKWRIIHCMFYFGRRILTGKSIYCILTPLLNSRPFDPANRQLVHLLAVHLHLGFITRLHFIHGGDKALPDTPDECLHPRK
jgi:hypothetical protein